VGPDRFFRREQSFFPFFPYRPREAAVAVPKPAPKYSLIFQVCLDDRATLKGSGLKALVAPKIQAVTIEVGSPIIVSPIFHPIVFLRSMVSIFRAPQLRSLVPGGPLFSKDPWRPPPAISGQFWQY